MNDDFDPHLYVGPGYSDAAYRRNVLPYVARHDMAIVLNDYSVDPETAGDDVRDRLREASERDVDVWLGTGLLPDEDDVEDPSLATSDADLVADDSMERFEAVHRRVADTYAEFYPEGRVILWHEMPYMGNWAGDTYEEKGESAVENGPAVFEAQKDAIREASGDLSVGVFPHWPVVPDSDHTEVPVFERLLGRMADRGVLPDFTYFDYYRGYYEWSAGYEACNEWLDAAVTNVKDHTGDRPVYCLCQAHTINNHYTPSKQAIVGNVRAALGAGVDALGWYSRSAYRSTRDRNFDPFVPNVGTVDEDQFTSFTGSRDRLQYACMYMLEQRAAFAPDERFDLWVYGHDFDFYENAVSLRTAEGDWEFVGDVSGYADGDNPYSGGDRERACIVHALDRDRYLDDGELQVRVEGRETGDGATLAGVAAVPYVEAGLYRTELDATGHFQNGDPTERFALGTWRGERDVAPDDQVTVSCPVADPDRRLRAVVYPGYRDAYERMARIEAEDSAREYFDLWVYGTDLGGLHVAAGDDGLAEYRDSSEPESADGTEAVAYRGLQRERFLQSAAGGQYLDLRFTADDAVALFGAYAMPCGGTANFASDTAVAEVLDRDYGEAGGQVQTFALGNATWPEGVRVDADAPFEAWVHVPNRRAISRPE